MARYVVKRVLMLIPMLLIIIFIVSFIMSLTPSDPGTLILGERATKEAIHQLNEELGYNDPFLIRYARYVFSAVHGDLGKSWKSGAPVIQEIVRRFPATFTLAVGAIFIGLTIGMTLGILSAVKQYSALDVAGTAFSMTLASFPGFWIGMMLIILFALKLGWLPSFGVGSLKHYILPWFTTSCSFGASMLRMTRTSMLESIRMDYIRTARAKGQTEKLVILRHALRNALLPVVTILGMSFGGLLGGTVTIETVFSIPGVGSLIIEAIRMKDIPVVVGATVTLATCFTLLMLLVDILYAFIDPRIKARYLKY
ncbi:MAG: ABC transporter permease [Synergistaceae bacterium]|jgi:peptide/nickel transport system permease protein|nr:ABC transporter permease [Synergistaceae bacterium]